MKYSLNLGKIAGTRLEIHWTFVLLIGWVVLVNLRAGSGFPQVMWSVFFTLAVFVCVVLHEFGHVLMAKRFKGSTSKVTLLPIGGLAQMESLPEKPKEELLIAFAGPAVNVVIAAALFPFAGPHIQDLDEANAMTDLNGFLVMLMSINIWLTVFNLIPAFPMDGGRVLRALMAFRMGFVNATRIAARIGQFLAFGFIVLGFMYNPFLVLIGFFIYAGAGSEATYVEMKSVLHRYKVKDATMHEIPFIDVHLLVKEAVAMLLNSQNKNFVVVDNGNPVGTLSRDRIIEVWQRHDGNVEVDSIKNNELIYLTGDQPLDQVWTEMRRNNKHVMLVRSNGTLEGIVDDENLMEFIQIHAAKR